MSKKVRKIKSHKNESSRKQKSKKINQDEQIPATKLSVFE